MSYTSPLDVWNAARSFFFHNIWA